MSLTQLPLFDLSAQTPVTTLPVPVPTLAPDTTWEAALSGFGGVLANVHTIWRALSYTEALGREEEADVERRWRKDGERYLHGPVILHRSGWEDMTPDWLLRAIPAARLGWLWLGEWEQATEEEALAYLYPATHQAPFTHEWATLYFWLGSCVLPRWGRAESSEAVWDKLAVEPYIAREPTPWMLEELARLRRWLWRRVVAGGKRGER